MTVAVNQSEREQVAEMKVERLVVLGYRRDFALRLAFDGVDIHLVEKLVKQGCSLPTAARIAR